jgi:hypothetical protein
MSKLNAIFNKTGTGAGEWARVNSLDAVLQVVITGTVSLDIEMSYNKSDVVNIATGITASGAYATVPRGIWIRGNITSGTGSAVIAVAGN